MNKWIIAVAVLVVSGCATRSDFFASFDEWQQRLDAKPKTGFAWTLEDMMLDRTLGAQAHQHEAFLSTKLQANPHVVRILDASPRLCQKYAVPPPPTKGGYVVEDRQQLWLKSISKETSQQKIPPYQNLRAIFER